MTDTPEKEISDYAHGFQTGYAKGLREKAQDCKALIKLIEGMLEKTEKYGVFLPKELTHKEWYEKGLVEGKREALDAVIKAVQGEL